MLREAASVDEAVDLAKAAQHFAAWSFFVSDAKTRKVARIEVNGDGVKAVRYEDEAVAQTNHFLHPDWVERSEEHTSELQSLMRISYAVFCLTKKKLNSINTN